MLYHFTVNATFCDNYKLIKTFARSRIQTMIWMIIRTLIIFQKIWNSNVRCLYKETGKHNSNFQSISVYLSVDFKEQQQNNSNNNNKLTHHFTATWVTLPSKHAAHFMVHIVGIVPLQDKKEFTGKFNLLRQRPPWRYLDLSLRLLDRLLYFLWHWGALRNPLYM